MRAIKYFKATPKYCFLLIVLLFIEAVCTWIVEYLTANKGWHVSVCRKHANAYEQNSSYLAATKNMIYDQAETIDSEGHGSARKRAMQRETYSITCSTSKNRKKKDGTLRRKPTAQASHARQQRITAANAASAIINTYQQRMNLIKSSPKCSKIHILLLLSSHRS